jgi:tRNA (adenine57-N1/adenine58-N1)-methyltransferase
MAYGPLADGDAVVLIDARGRRYLKQLVAGHRLTVRGSVVRCDDLIGENEGSLTDSAEAERFRVFRASYADIATSLERPAEPIFAKDAGAIMVFADVRAGDRVIEVGVGAGAMTVALLRAIGPHGTLTSYERRADFAAVARQNVRRFQGETPNWTLEVRDASAGLDQVQVDRIVVDVPVPSEVLGPTARSLRAGGTLAIYLPTILQVAELHLTLGRTQTYACVETRELLERGWHVDERSVRPDHRMVAHTGFLTFARRTTEPVDATPA